MALDVCHLTWPWTTCFSVSNLFSLDTILYFLTKGWRSWQPRCWKLCLGGGLFWCTVAFVGVGRGWRQSVLITVNIFWVAEGRRNRSRKYMWSLFALGYHFDWWHQEMEDQDGYWDDSIWGKILRRRGHNLLSQTKFEHSNGVDSGLVVPIAEKIWPMERRYCSMLRFCMGFFLAASTHLNKLDDILYPFDICGISHLGEEVFPLHPRGTVFLQCGSREYCNYLLIWSIVSSWCFSAHGRRCIR